MPDMVDRPDVVRDNPSVPHYHSTFQLKELRLTTEQFGYVKPHVVFDDVSSDDVEYNCQYRTRSYTLKAPLMQDVHRKLSYVKVDLSCILPFNFEKFFTNPVIGDDVLPQVGPVSPDGFKRIATTVDTLLSTSIASIQGVGNFTKSSLQFLWKSLIFSELFYSRGCLLSSLGAHLCNQFECAEGTDKYHFDDFFDHVISTTVAQLTGFGVIFIDVTIDGINKRVCLSSNPYYLEGSGGVITLREFLSIIRETGDWSIDDFKQAGGSSVDMSTANYSFNPGISVYACYNMPFNFGRVCAYQLACAEFMTNDKVDHLYSAELYRQYIGSLLRDADLYINNATHFDNLSHFTYNGVKYQYDFLTGNYLEWVLTELNTYPATVINVSAVLQYFLTLFGYRRSLRYKDYFVSSRVRPLAVGNVDVAVNANLVSVIDISRNIQVQRFLNAVNHSGRRLSNYIKTLFGNDIRSDRHVPQWLADVDELIYTNEVENTGAAQQTSQQSITATFTGNSSSKMLHFYADLPGYIIGLTSYDIERAYIDGIDRSFFVKDRFDMFIPEMQFIGDQPIYLQELNGADLSSFGTSFGYQYRDMQYKLFHAIADGGFPDNLPGFAFMYRHPSRYLNARISPDFIRSRPSELDDFYLSLTGFSLGNYFHFISKIENNFSAKRPMIANPKILE